MKGEYQKPVVKAVSLYGSHPLLIVSGNGNVNATMSGYGAYNADDDDTDGFSQSDN